MSLDATIQEQYEAIMAEKPWMTPKDNFEEDARDFVSDSPYGQELVEGLRSCASPFIRAAIIKEACGADDVPFLLRIAEQRS